MNKIISLAIAAMAIAAAPATGATYSAFASFNGTNGNGGFTYGYTDNTTLTAFDTSASGAGCALAGATCLISAANGVLPFASVGGSFPTVNVPTNAITVHPGNSASLSDYVSFTAPNAGSFNYSISVQSRGIDTTNGIGYTPFSATGGVVTLGSRSVLSNYLDSATLTGTTLLSASQQFGVIIDFNGVYFGDSTGINFNISDVPEPATWGMLLVGFGMVGVAARRRKVVTVA